MSAPGSTGDLAPASPAFPLSSRYRVLTVLSSGDASTVYVASLRGPNGFERRVAIKRAHPHLLKEPNTRRFMAEAARLAGRLNHPNVVGMRDVEDLDGELLLVMDYVEGVSLARLLAGGPLPTRVAGRILLDAATGLSAVHALADSGEATRPIIHNDVSTANILVGTDGTARISDFGVAKNAHPDRAADSSPRLGAPARMTASPTAAHVTTPLVDVFAMGVVAWETLTSRRLFDDSPDGESTLRGRQTPIPAPSWFVPELPPTVDAAILEALATDPRKRCDARTFAAALETALHRAGLLAMRPEVESFVNERCGEDIGECRRRIRAASRSGREASLSRDAARVSPPLQRSAESALTCAVSARELVAATATSSKGLVAWLLGAALLATVAIGSFGVSGSMDARSDALVSSARAAQPVAASQSAVAPPPVSGSASVSAPSHPPTEMPSLPPAAAPHTPAPVAPTPVAGETVPAAPLPVAPPMDCEALAERAEQRLEARDVAGAESLYQRALAQNPRYLPARIAIADIEWSEGRTELARRAYGSLLEQFAPELLPARVETRARTTATEP